MSIRSDILYLSHGGGPLPLLGDEGHREMVATLQSIASRIKKPSALLVVSAHWEATAATVTSAAHPSLVYDYYGFAPEAYRIEYPSPGKPALAEQVYEALKGAGIDAKLDGQRGFDHGMFVPLKIMYPEADIPCVQLSLVKGLEPALHITMGRALRSLEVDDLLVIGSGFSFHNMQAFFAPETQESRQGNHAFDHWLQETCCSRSLDETQRTQRLVHWTEAPSARYCHPREEHLLPLHLCYGLAGASCSEHFDLTILGKKASMFLWSGKLEGGRADLAEK